MKKILILFIGLAFLASIGTTASAQSDSITDPANDVYIPGGQTGISNKPHIDVREITYTFDASGLTLTMILQGNVLESGNDVYSVSLETEDASYVFLYDSEGGYAAASDEEHMAFVPYFGEVSHSGNTIIATFDRVGSFFTAVEFSGYATEDFTYWDDVPNENGGTTPPPDGNGGTTPPPGGNGDTTTPPSGNGTPGFEIIAVLAALGAALIIIKKRQ